MEAMIDIETLDTELTAVVYQVAVVFFKGNGVHPYFWNIAVTEQVNAGRTISGDTMAFHLGGDHAQDMLDAMSSFGRVPLTSFADRFRQAFAENQPTAVWTKGTFDCPIIASLIGDVPWKFYQVKELRTLMNECGVPKGKVAHNAMDDCIDQIKALKKCRAVIRKGLK